MIWNNFGGRSWRRGAARPLLALGVKKAKHLEPSAWVKTPCTHELLSSCLECRGAYSSPLYAKLNIREWAKQVCQAFAAVRKEP